MNLRNEYDEIPTHAESTKEKSPCACGFGLTTIRANDAIETKKVMYTVDSIYALNLEKDLVSDIALTNASLDGIMNVYTAKRKPA